MSVLAVLVAIPPCSVTALLPSPVLAQARASDQWNEYQAKRIRQHEATLTAICSRPCPLDQSAARSQAKYRKNIDQWAAELEAEAVRRAGLKRKFAWPNG